MDREDVVVEVVRAARGAGAACLFMALAYAAVAVLGAGGAPTAENSI